MTNRIDRENCPDHRKGISRLIPISVIAGIFGLSSLVGISEDVRAKIRDLAHRLEIKCISGDPGIERDARIESTLNNDRVQARRDLSVGNFEDIQKIMKATSLHALVGDQVKYGNQSLETPSPDAKASVIILSHLLERAIDDSTEVTLQNLVDLTKTNVIKISTLPNPTFSYATASSEIGSDISAPIIAISPSALCAALHDCGIPAAFNQSDRIIVIPENQMGLHISVDGTLELVRGIEKKSLTNWRQAQIDELRGSKFLAPNNPSFKERDALLTALSKTNEN